MSLIDVAREFLMAVKHELDPYTTRKGEVVQSGQFEFTLLTPSHIHFAKYGRGPGRMPPVDPLLKWVQDKGIQFDGLTQEGTAWAIAKSIEKRGTKNYVPNAPNALDEALTKHYRTFGERMLNAFAVEIQGEIFKDTPPFPREIKFGI